MEYSVEYYLNYWGPFAITLALSFVFVKLGLSKSKIRESQTKELIEISRQTLIAVSEIKSLLEDRKS